MHRDTSSALRRCVGLLLWIAVPLVIAQQPGCPCDTESARAALTVLYESAGGRSWHRRDNWVSDGASVCSWVGFDCAELNLTGNNLVGTLPPELGNISGLRHLLLSDNALSGTLPPELKSLTAIVELRIERNRLVGTLPPEYSVWGALQSLNVADNRLDGSLPPGYSNWRQMKFFSCCRNQVSGVLPAEYAAWSLVETVHLCENTFSGSLPPELSSWTKLRNLDLQHNTFNGTLPPEYQSWVLIGGFAIANNSFCGSLPREYSIWAMLTDFLVGRNGFSGPLPKEYASWSFVKSFWANHMHLNGSIPAEYSRWTLLIDFNVRNNSLSGALPPSLSSWLNAKLVYFAQNSFSGTLPLEYASWVNISRFDCSENLLSGTLPAILASWASINFLSLSFNAFYGTLPPEYTVSMSLVQVFAVSNNFLTGPLPPVVRMSRVIILAFGDNDFIGTVPAQWALGIAGPMQMLSLLNNRRLGGPLPAFPWTSMVVAVCNTSICGALPSGWSTSQYVVPLFACQPFVLEIAFEFQADPSRLLALLAPVPKTLPACTRSAAPEPLTTTSAPSDRREIAVSAVESTARAVAGLAAVAGMLGSLAPAAFGAQRMVMVSRRSCGDGSVDEDDVNVFEAPLQLRVGSSSHAGRSGAVVGNVALMAALCAAVPAAAWLHAVLVSGGSVSASLSALRAPGSCFVAVPALLGPVSLHWASPVLAGGSGAADIASGCVGAVAVAVVLVALWWVLCRPSQFAARPCAVPLSVRAQSATVAFRRLAAWLTTPCESWGVQRTATASVFVRRYGLLFEGCRGRWRWWSFAEAAYTVVLGLVCGVVPREATAACRASDWAALGLSAAFVGAVVVCRPMASRLDNGIAILFAVAQASIALCVALEEDGADAISAAVACVSLCVLLSSVGSRVAEACRRTGRSCASSGGSPRRRVEAHSRKVIRTGCAAELHVPSASMLMLVWLACKRRKSREDSSPSRRE